jgi:putative ABC transport system ATP-binding protein
VTEPNLTEQAGQSINQNIQPAIQPTVAPVANINDNLEKLVKENLIVARNISKSYQLGEVLVAALHNVNLQIKKGEMVAIMGPSGCGKTTLLNCLSGLDEVNAGQIWINGTSLESMTDNQKSDFRAKHMGFVFQFYNLLPVLSALENVEMPMRIAGVTPDRAHERSMHLLELVGLKERWSHKPAELSGGQRQRVTIARALINNPLIVWADEPTGDLDSNTSEEILNLMCELNMKNHQTFVLVTHDSKVASRANRIIRMSNGMIV